METQIKYFELDLNFDPKDESNDLDNIKHTVELYSNQKIDIKLRTNNIVFLRAVYYELARKLTSKNLKNIGLQVNRDHATVLHGLKIFPDVFKMEYYRNLYLKCYESLEQKKLLTEDEIEGELILKNYKDRITELEDSLEIVSQAVNNEVIKKLLALDSQELRVFNDTRLKPFLKMRSRYAKV